jgi:hypothetical protein
VETLTTLALRTYLPVHIFLGLLLLPPVALKLASTGWRFLRYYTRNKPYRLEGAPRLLLRMLAPLLVVSTLSLFGSGIALIAVGHGGGVLRTVHALSFIAWGVLMIVHVLAYFKRVLRIGTSDWRRNAGLVVAGARARRAALGAALLAGVIVALATYPAQQAWLSHRRDDGHRDGLGRAPAVAIREIATPIRRPASPSRRLRATPIRRAMTDTRSRLLATTTCRYLGWSTPSRVSNAWPPS